MTTNQQEKQDGRINKTNTHEGGLVTMTDYATYRAVMRTMPPEPYHTPADVDCRVTPNVGELMAAAIAAAGSYAIVTGGRVPCETDYLAASGATFPAHVTYEQMVDFNRRTLKPDMDEANEHARYRPSWTTACDVSWIR